MTQELEPDWFLPDVAPPVGDNNPPDMVATAQETMQAISDWMSEHPVIDTFDAAKEAKVMLDRGKLCIKDMEDERTGKVSPLNRQVADINDYYRSPRELLTRVLQIINVRMDDYLKAEERKRQAAAEEARLKMVEAERVAREAEQKEREAKEAAEQGELGVDVAARVVGADEAFSAYEKAQRAAAVAEKETKVKVAGGFTRAIGLRTEKIYTVTDPVKLTDELFKLCAYETLVEINEVLIKAAKAYQKFHGKLPPGIEVKTERKV